MLQWLASLITAPVVHGVIEAYKAKLSAQNSEGQMAADLAAKAIAAEIEARKSADALIMAEQGRWYTAIIRPLLALPVVVFMWKVIVWDKVLGLGSTDGLQGFAATTANLVVSFYFVKRGFENVARIIKR